MQHDAKVVCVNGNIGDWLKTTAGFRLGYLLEAFLFSIFFGRVMSEALQDHETTVSFEGKKVTKSFALQNVLMVLPVKYSNTRTLCNMDDSNQTEQSHC